jgi:citrate lyase synthetase
MTIREYRPHDLEQLRQIHAKHFKNEFRLPDFLTKYICAVTIEDNDGIIVSGGVRNIAEVVAVTNKDRSVRDRRDALLSLWRALAIIAHKYGHSELHAFIQDEAWLATLERHAGFRKTKGVSLVTEI